MPGWLALIGPAGMPPAIVSKYQQELAKILRMPDVKEKLMAVGMDPWIISSQELDKFVLSEIDRWGIGDSWGNPWEFLHPVEGPGIKLFPSGTTSFPAGECALEIQARHKPAPDQIESIVWKTTPLSMNIAMYAIPNDQNEAFYCVPWAIAAALVDGRLGLRQFDDDKIQDKTIRAVCAKVKVEGHPDMKDAKSPDHVGGELTVTMKNGDVYTHLRKRPRAYPGSEPITREQLVGKFEENAARVLSASASKAAEKQLFDIRNVPSVKKLLATLTP